MILSNLRIVTPTRVIERGYLVLKDGKIQKIVAGDCHEESVDCHGLIAMPGFIDIHIHGSAGIDFMNADVEGIQKIAKTLYEEGVTTFLATTLTSDEASLENVCRVVKEAKASVPSLGGIHFEGPYISEKHKGAQNAAYIRNPSIEEYDRWVELSGDSVKDITLAPEKEGAMDFIAHASKCGTTCSAGHSDANFDQIAEAMEHGLTNTTHTHNAMSGHHHRNPGIVTAAMYFDGLYTEMICDKIHVCPNVMKTFYKIVGPDRFIIITDALKAKHSNLEHFELFGLPCVKKNGAAYLESGPLAGSLLSMDQGVRNMKEVAGCGLVELSKISATNAAKAVHLDDRGALEIGKLADLVLLDDSLQVKEVYKLGKKVF